MAKPTLPDWNTLALVMPELCLILGMCAVILTPFIRRRSVALHTVTCIVSLVLALITALTSLGSFNGAAEPIFHGMLAVDPFSQFFKFLLILFTLFIVVQWLIVTREDTDVLDVPDFLCLLLGATFGMALMASATNLLMIFVATEAASFPSFALAGFRKRNRIGSESSLKYVIFGAASSAIMVYGMSLIYGTTGTLSLAGIADVAVNGLPGAAQGSEVVTGVSPLLAVGLLAMFAGLAFKLSAVPLHFWCPDVFEGAPFEVTTFLSVASKGAAVALLLRVLHVFGAMSGESGSSVFVGLAVGVGILGAVTATWGNLVAIHQTNIKRLLAYSSIAHSGYMIMAAAVIIGAAGDPDHMQVIGGALLFYLFVYLFMNLGAFTIGGLIAKETGSEDIRDYAMLIRRSPALAVLMTLFLLSLFGMPGLGGFMGKIYLMAAMAKAGPGGFALIAVLLINTLISLYYYLRPVYYMVFVVDEEQRPMFVPRGFGVGLLSVCALAVLLTGIYSPAVHRFAEASGQLLVPRPTAAARAVAPETTSASAPVP